MDPAALGVAVGFSLRLAELRHVSVDSEFWSVVLPLIGTRTSPRKISIVGTVTENVRNFLNKFLPAFNCAIAYDVPAHVVGFDCLLIGRHVESLLIGTTEFGIQFGCLEPFGQLRVNGNLIEFKCVGFAFNDCLRAPFKTDDVGKVWSNDKKEIVVSKLGKDIFDHHGFPLQTYLWLKFEGRFDPTILGMLLFSRFGKLAVSGAEFASLKMLDNGAAMGVLWLGSLPLASHPVPYSHKCLTKTGYELPANLDKLEVYMLIVQAVFRADAKHARMGDRLIESPSTKYCSAENGKLIVACQTLLQPASMFVESYLGSCTSVIHIGELLKVLLFYIASGSINLTAGVLSSIAKKSGKELGSNQYVLEPPYRIPEIVLNNIGKDVYISPERLGAAFASMVRARPERENEGGGKKRNGRDRSSSLPVKELQLSSQDDIDWLVENACGNLIITKGNNKFVDVNKLPMELRKQLE